MSMKQYTLSEIKELNTAAGGRFFSRENMKFAGDTMANFGVSHDKENGCVFIRRKRAMKKYMPLSVWEFNTVDHSIKYIG